MKNIKEILVFVFVILLSSCSTGAKIDQGGRFLQASELGKTPFIEIEFPNSESCAIELNATFFNENNLVCSNTSLKNILTFVGTMSVGENSMPMRILNKDICEILRGRSSSENPVWYTCPL